MQLIEQDKSKYGNIRPNYRGKKEKKAVFNITARSEEGFVERMTDNGKLVGRKYQDLGEGPILHRYLLTKNTYLIKVLIALNLENGLQITHML